ncbi:MAG: DegT/DnrJ/EryC1/StrS family aminotransferase [Proteobacteria bacterium]|nr:DegT/DnrJ/EryC1/StrS family aminotransferase [Pseudomonadota bacterium]
MAPLPPKRIIPISQPALGEEEWQALREPVLSGWVTQGPKVAEFERQFSKHHRVKHAIAVSSCTTGLHLALLAMGVGQGDEVIVPAFTWIATANVVLHCGATPVFVDIDRLTYNLSLAELVQKVTARTKVVVPVHLFGRCSDIAAIRALLPADVKILEDAACAVGASLRGIPAGSQGDAAAFSFHPRKVITTGEGGMVTTNNDELAEIMNQLRNHGATVSEEQRHIGPKPYILPDFNLPGYNYRMTDLQGAIGVVQLSKLEALIKERSKWANWYKQRLSCIEWLRCPEESIDGNDSWQAYVVYVYPDKSPMTRNDIMEILLGKGIATRPGTHAVHMTNFYRRKFNIRPEQFPNAMDCDGQTIAIPLHNNMSAQDYEYVVEQLKSI